MRALWFVLSFVAIIPQAQAVELVLRSYEDPSSALAIHQILETNFDDWAQVHSREASFGFTQSRIWLRFRIPDKWPNDSTLLLEVPNALLERVDFYRMLDGKVQQAEATGLSVPVPERTYGVLAVGHPTFRIPGPRNPMEEYFLAVKTRYPMTVPIRVYGPNEFAYQHWTRILALGIFLGALFIGAIYNGFMAYTLRSRLYGSYAVFLVAITFGFLSTEALTVQILWPSLPWLAVRELHIFNGLAVIFYCDFVREFLSSRRRMPWLDRILLALVAISTVRLVWVFFDLYQPMISISFAAVALVNVVVMVIAIRGLMLGVTSAKFFLVSSTLFNFFAIGFILQQTNIVWFGDFMRYGPHLGTAIEVLVLSLALAFRVHMLKVDNSKQRAALIHNEKMSVLGKMAGEIAHEINNPLAIIHGNATLLRQESLSPAALNYVETIEQTVTRISRVVKSIRALVRNSTQDPFAAEPVAQVVQNAISLCEERAEKMGARLQSSAIPEGLVIRCRSAEIIQVLVNLLSNALDALEGKSDRLVTIDAREKGNMVEISVTDTGAGIPPPLRARLHEPFFTTKEAGKGLGLGLSIARAVVNAHGGQLWLDEASEKTRFVFTVPCARQA